MDNSAPILTVSRLSSLLKEVVEENFVQVLVGGEISNFSSPSSGHLYFSLKDSKAQVRGVMFRSQARLLPFRPENGMEVVCAGRLSVYSPRGEVQLVVESMEPRGVGSLQLAFEQLKDRLRKEGLFDENIKQPLPSFPKTIGVVTSATGAAFQDILNVLGRRGAGLRVLLRPVRVQGEGAAEEIAQAVVEQNRYGQADVLIVGRGGGSLEDLWAFNEEVVARAVRASKIPVISAVGHETDHTISDMAADFRAPTPSAAAELVVKSRLELEAHLDHLVQRLAVQMKGRTALMRQRLDGLCARLRSPAERIAQQSKVLDDLEGRLLQGVKRRLADARGELALQSGRLDALSPLKTLERGYAIALEKESGRAICDSKVLKEGDLIEVRFSRGSIEASVESIKS